MTRASWRGRPGSSPRADDARARPLALPRPDRPVEPVRLAAGAGEEVERRGRAGGGVVAERDPPQPREGDRRAAREPQLPLVDPAVVALGVGADPTVAEVADEQVAPEDGEAGGREREAPR